MDGNEVQRRTLESGIGDIVLAVLQRRTDPDIMMEDITFSVDSRRSGAVLEATVDYGQGSTASHYFYVERGVIVGALTEDHQRVVEEIIQDPSVAEELARRHDEIVRSYISDSESRLSEEAIRRMFDLPSK